MAVVFFARQGQKSATVKVASTEICLVLFHLVLHYYMLRCVLVYCGVSLVGYLPSVTTPVSNGYQPANQPTRGQTKLSTNNG